MEHFKFSGSTLLGIVVFPADFSLPIALLDGLDEFMRDSRIIIADAFFVVETDNAPDRAVHISPQEVLAVSVR